MAVALLRPPAFCRKHTMTETEARAWDTVNAMAQRLDEAYRLLGAMRTQMSDAVKNQMKALHLTGAAMQFLRQEQNAVFLVCGGPVYRQVRAAAESMYAGQEILEAAVGDDDDEP